YLSKRIASILMALIRRFRSVNMFFNELSPIYFEVPISRNQTETVWVTDSVTMAYVRRRINEISGNYLIEPNYLSSSAIGAPTADIIPTSTKSLNMAENQCHGGYPSRNILIVFGLGMVLIIVLLLLNCYGMIVIRRSRHRKDIENISADPLELHGMFPDLNQRTRQQSQQEMLTKR
ncbi:unnamed protein product, partial [Rotaria sp. Silwood2]